MPLPGQPRDEPIPPRLDRWNWGAFLLNWIWGIGNSTYIALLMFIPGVNLVMVFVLGARGSRWAWRNRIWADEDHFRRTQRNWARAGVIVLVGLALFIPAAFFGMLTLMTNTDAYRQSMEIMRTDQRVIAVMGEPIEAGWFVTGNVSLNNDDGTSELSIPVSGPKASGRLISRATKTDGVWTVNQLALLIDGQSEPIVLIGGGRSTSASGDVALLTAGGD
ncbi:cytochrome c oxidase assembly factor Coa1 family protein [Bauldia sp.]|uniref:cytochrome c oxidase assembly factor Coa1 family protein n=1 Tax=Bauldia sp. TaxID=2575872 RepID=UPI003BAC46D3